MCYYPKVDLYQNSINVLEAAEDRAEKEVRDSIRKINNGKIYCDLTQIQQQRVTISNLQDALIATKNELDQLREKSTQDVSVSWASRWLGTALSKPAQNNKTVHDI